jgi:hypothetical protein
MMLILQGYRYIQKLITHQSYNHPYENWRQLEQAFLNEAKRPTIINPTHSAYTCILVIF